MADDFSPVIRSELQDSQFLILGDANHGNVVSGFAARRDHMQAMAQAGVKHFMIEEGREFQPLLDAHYAGSLSTADLEQQALRTLYKSISATNGKAAVPDDQPVPEDFAQAHREYTAILAQTAENGRSVGIRVHAIDNHAGLVESRGLFTAQQEVIGRRIRFIFADMQAHAPEVYARYNSLTEAQVDAGEAGRIFEAYEKTLPPDRRIAFEASVGEAQRAYDQTAQAWVAVRLAGDRELADHVMKIAGGDKAVIVYGSGHLETTADLDNFLGHERTRRVIIAPNAADFQALRPATPELSGTAAEPVPFSGIYLIEEGRYVPNTSAAVAAACAEPAIDMRALDICRQPTATEPISRPSLARGKDGPENSM